MKNPYHLVEIWFRYPANREAALRIAQMAKTAGVETVRCTAVEPQFLASDISGAADYIKIGEGNLSDGFFSEEEAKELFQ